MNVYGKIYLHDSMSFKDQDNPENKMVMGNILEKDIYTIIKEWNESLDGTKNGLSVEIEKDDFTDIIDRIKGELLKIDQSCRVGEFENAKKILDRAESYYAVVLNQREEMLSKLEIEIEKELENWDSAFDYIKYLAQNNPDKYKQIGRMEKMFNPEASEMFENVLNDLKNIRKILEERKKLDIPGSIFEKPIRNDFTGIVDLATRIKCMWEFAKLFKNIKMD